MQSEWLGFCYGKCTLDIQIIMCPLHLPNIGLSRQLVLSPSWRRRISECKQCKQAWVKYSKTQLVDPVCKINVFSPHLQKLLWEQLHASSNKHVPGKLIQKWRNVSYVLQHVHPSLHWHKRDPLDMLPVVTDSPWQIVQNVYVSAQKEIKLKKPNILNFIPAQGSVPVTSLTSATLK